jgi:hypothetical protein
MRGDDADLDRLRMQAAGVATLAQTDVALGGSWQRSGQPLRPAAATGTQVRPLSDALGHYRILRTSPAHAGAGGVLPDVLRR